MFRKARLALEQAKALDPGLGAEVRGTRGFIASRELSWIEAHEDFQYALEHAPENADIHGSFSEFLSRVGHNALSLEQAKIARELDSLSPVINARLSLAYLWVDDQDAATRQWAIQDELGFKGSEGYAGYWRTYLLMLLRQGDAVLAKEALAHHQQEAGLPVEPVLPLIDAILDPRLRDRAVQSAGQIAKEGTVAPALQLPMWILLDELDAAYTSFHALEATPWDINIPFIFAHESHRFRADPRFEQLMEDVGLAAYWDQYGPPDTRGGIER